jgi:hypothetical protein
MSDVEGCESDDTVRMPYNPEVDTRERRFHAVEVDK